MSEHEHPVTITDKRGVSREKVQAEQDLRADHPGHGEVHTAEGEIKVSLGAEETDEVRAARIKTMLLDGKGLSDEDRQWFLSQQEATDLPPEIQPVRSVFVVVIEHSGNALVANSEILKSVEADGDANFDDIYAAVCLVKRDLDARQAAGTVMMEMQRQAQAQQQQQMNQRAAQGMQIPNNGRRG